MTEISVSVLLVAAGFAAGALNALAGGGPLITLAALLLTGLDARAANMTSTVALFPGQIATGLASRNLLSKAKVIPVAMLVAINIVGSMAGVWMLGRINETLLRLFVISVGAGLTFWLFWVG